MSDERESERQRWADRLDLEVVAMREHPDANTVPVKITASILSEWANRLRFNEPDGNTVPPGVRPPDRSTT